MLPEASHEQRWLFSPAPIMGMLCVCGCVRVCVRLNIIALFATARMRVLTFPVLISAPQRLSAASRLHITQSIYTKYLHFCSRIMDLHADMFEPNLMQVAVPIQGRLLEHGMETDPHRLG